MVTRSEVCNLTKVISRLISHLEIGQSVCTSSYTRLYHTAELLDFTLIMSAFNKYMYTVLRITDQYAQNEVTP